MEQKEQGLQIEAIYNENQTIQLNSDKETNKCVQTYPPININTKRKRQSYNRQIQICTTCGKGIQRRNFPYHKLKVHKEIKGWRLTQFQKNSDKNRVRMKAQKQQKFRNMISICEICGKAIKRKNLRNHRKKIHPDILTTNMSELNQEILENTVDIQTKDHEQPVSYTHLTLPTKRIV